MLGVSVTNRLLDDVTEWHMIGWALFFSDVNYVAVCLDAIQNWPRVSSKRIRAEIEAAHKGEFDFKKLDYLFRRASDDQHDAEERRLTDE
jgi:hypothetical protein